MAQVPGKRKRKPTIGGDELAQEVAHLLALDAPALRARWTEIFGVAPSPSLGRRLLVRAIAYRLQDCACGGLKSSTDRLLDRVGDAGSAAKDRRSARKPRAAAGTVLIREWGGVSHRVTVHEDDVVYGRQHYKSLSEVARAITGSRWSGPLFFGLRERAKEEANG